MNILLGPFLPYELCKLLIYPNLPKLYELTHIVETEALL